MIMSNSTLGQTGRGKNPGANEAASMKTDPTLATRLKQALKEWQEGVRNTKSQNEVLRLLRRYSRAALSGFVQQISEADREDLVQDAAWKVWTCLVDKDYEIQEGCEYSFSRRVTINYALNHLRRHKREIVVEDPRGGEEDSEEPAMEESLDRERLRGRLFTAMEALPPTPRWVLTQIYIHQKTPEELTQQRLDSVLAERGHPLLEATALEAAKKKCRNWVDVNHRRGRELLKELLSSEKGDNESTTTARGGGL